MRKTHHLNLLSMRGMNSIIPLIGVVPLARRGGWFIILMILLDNDMETSSKDEILTSQNIPLRMTD